MFSFFSVTEVLCRQKPCKQLITSAKSPTKYVQTIFRTAEIWMPSATVACTTKTESYYSKNAIKYNKMQLLIMKSPPKGSQGNMPAVETSIKKRKAE